MGQQRRFGGLNRWGAYICGPCKDGQHLGVFHMGLCQCSCDGRHDSKGNLIKEKSRGS